MTTTVVLTIPHFAAIVTGVGACIVDALGQTPAGAPTRQCLLLPTQTIPWDDCDCGGQIAQTIQRTYGSVQFPQEAPYTRGWDKCGPNYQVAQVLVSVTRCITGINQEGQPPPCNVALAEAYTLENDRIAVRQAIFCCLQDLKQARPPTLGVVAFMLGPSVTVGAQGACAGVETTYFVGMSACSCPGG